MIQPKAFCVGLICITALLLLGCASRNHIGEEVAWDRSAAMSAPEARQAAAADERFVYAIGSDVIAKYDRATGARVASSSGEAHHLNSGFLYAGRLYCAHSNFPQTPESSQIMLLDVGSMRLSLLKDFGNFGGSLTWVIHRNGHWWCNFARYGKDNEQTFLVEFDEKWRELRRWSYPPELIGKLGKYSLSGGVWRDGMLMVTGHDNPVIYLLRLPQRGNVLEFVDQKSVPFTGQGIANDPRGGGLVGINRKNREVIFAKPVVSR